MKRSTVPKKRMETSRPFPIVGIGASAGGLEAVTDLLQGLPPNPEMAFVDINLLKMKNPTSPK